MPPDDSCPVDVAGGEGAGSPLVERRLSWCRQYVGRTRTVGSIDDMRGRRRMRGSPEECARWRRKELRRQAARRYSDGHGADEAGGGESLPEDGPAPEDVPAPGGSGGGKEIRAPGLAGERGRDVSRRFSDRTGVQHVRSEGGRGRGLDPRWPGNDASSAAAADSPFCFARGRMKIRWREADRCSDREGRPADETVGATSARRDWARILRSTIVHGELVRIRHQYHDEPALLVPESVFRSLERRAGDRTEG